MRHLLFIVRGCRAVCGFWQMIISERRSYPGMQIKMIGIDLDGTLLTKNKVMTSVSRQALEKAIQAGVEVVPVTGRPYTGVPADVLEIPGIRYVITSNGANTYDCGSICLMR